MMPASASALEPRMDTAMASSHMRMRFQSPMLTTSETAPMVQKLVLLPTAPKMKARMKAPQSTCGANAAGLTSFMDYIISGGGIARGIGNAGRLEAGFAQPAGIALTAGQAVRIGLVAGHGEPVVHAELHALSDDLRLAHGDEGRMQHQRRAFDRGLGREVGQALERLHILRPAVGIAGIIDGVRAEENVLAAQHLGPGERERQHDG